MGAFTQGGMAFGQGVGRGIRDYRERKEKRELLSGEAHAIYNELYSREEAGGKPLGKGEEEMLKKLENVGDMGTRELQGIISEYETGEKMDNLRLRKKILQQQAESAERKGTSEQGLMDYHKTMPSLEEGFQDPTYDEFENVPSYLLDPAKRQSGDPAIPEYDPVASPEQGPSLSMYKDIETKITSLPPLPPKHHAMSKKQADRWLDKELDVYEKAWGDASLELENHKNKGGSYVPPIPEREGLWGEIQSKADFLGRESFGDETYQKSRELSRKLDRAAERWEYLNKEKETNKHLPPMVVEGVEQDPLVTHDTSKVDANLAQNPSYYDPKMDAERLGSKTASGKNLADEGDTPIERREKLVSALADYDLTPEDRKKAIDMISEKYPKLKEVAAEAVSPSGKKLGFTIGGKFIPAKASVSSLSGGKGGLELSSITVNSDGEVTRILKPKAKLEQGQKTFINSAREFKNQAQELLDVVGSHGNWESSMMAFASEDSSAARAKLLSLPYRMAILYAKLVDPDSVAREGEVEAAKKYAIPIGFSTPNSVTEAALSSMLEEIMRRESSFYETENITPPETSSGSAGASGSNPLGY